MSDSDFNRRVFGDFQNQNRSASPLIPAATLVLLRDNAGALEVLMLKRNAKISFGGMWVFPGGRLEASDYRPGQDESFAARQAAVRETKEETGLSLNPSDFIYFAHWTPPPSTPKRFATWFFAASATTNEGIAIDGGEILSHRWISPADAIAMQCSGDIELSPPTWVTLYQLKDYSNSNDALNQLDRNKAQVYSTRIFVNEKKMPVALWSGDAAYDDGDLAKAGPRHRLLLDPQGFQFEHE